MVPMAPMDPRQYIGNVDAVQQASMQQAAMQHAAMQQVKHFLILFITNKIKKAWPRDYIGNMATMQQAAMQQAAVQQVKCFLKKMYAFSQASMANIVPTSNIGGMQQVKHISNHLLTPFSGCHGQPGQVQHGSDEERLEPLVYSLSVFTLPHVRQLLIIC